MFVFGNDDTIGNVLQTEITRDIDDDSDVLACGYKKTHPLEQIITFNISLNQK